MPACARNGYSLAASDSGHAHLRRYQMHRRRHHDQPASWRSCAREREPSPLTRAHQAVPTAPYLVNDQGPAMKAAMTANRPVLDMGSGGRGILSPATAGRCLYVWRRRDEPDARPARRGAREELCRQADDIVIRHSRPQGHNPRSKFWGDTRDRDDRRKGDTCGRSLATGKAGAGDYLLAKPYRQQCHRSPRLGGIDDLSSDGELHGVKGAPAVLRP